MSSSRRVILALGLCATIILLGTTGYVLVEGFAPGDALYMAIITVSTVGFGEVAPLSPAGRLITAGLIVVGITTVAYAGRAMVASLIEEAWSGKAEGRRMRNLIESVRSHIIICGYGRMGAAAAAALHDAAVPFVVVEKDEERCGTIRDQGHLYIQGDATLDPILLEAGIKRAGGLLALLDSDPLNLVVTLTARDLNPTLQIIARAEDIASEKRILRAGADSIVSPFGTAGRHVALEMLATTSRTRCAPGPEFDLPLPRWFEVQENDPFGGTPVGILRERLECVVLGIRRAEGDLLVPDDETPLEAGDRVLILEERRAVHREAEPLARVLVVDDNPVILHLYVRLLRKAGFQISTATSGEEAVARLAREPVEVAVIDQGLPRMSGIEVCRWIGDELGPDRPSCVLFTADERPETREEALGAGVQEVVLKSPEASDLVAIVRRVAEARRGSGLAGRPGTAAGR